MSRKSLAVIVSWLMVTTLGGCRFGNYTSSAPAPDPVTGYYVASPQSLEFCATTGATTCGNSPTAQIPAMISNEITDPVALIIQDASTGDAVLTAFNGNGQTALPVWVAADNITLYYSTSTAPQTLWNDPTCTTTTYLSESGSISASGAGVPVPGSAANTQGSLLLKVQVTQTFDGVNGSCAPELQTMSNCYQNVSQCGGSDDATNLQLQSRVQSIFAQYILAGVMKATDIAQMTNVAYEVHYQ